MGYLYKGDAILKGNLAVNTPKPLDERSVVQNSTELLTINSTYAYNGMLVVSIDEASVYILLDKNNISSLEGWKKIGTVVIDGNEIDLSSFITTSEVDSKLTTVKEEILIEVDTKISTNKTEILSEVDTKIDTALENFNPGSGGSSGGDVDLSNYVTKDELADYSTSTEIDNTYAKKTDIPTIDDTLTENSSNSVKSSGIYNGIKTMINAKFVVLTDAEYKAMASHDANTFYYIKQ